MSDEPKPSARAMAAAQALDDIGFLGDSYVEDYAAIIDQHLAAHDELLAACKASAKSPHHPTCPLYIHRPGSRAEVLFRLSETSRVGPCSCHVGQAQAAVALAEPEEKK